jgi:hypothetical protein
MSSVEPVVTRFRSAEILAEVSNIWARALVGAQQGKALI